MDVPALEAQVIGQYSLPKNIVRMLVLQPTSFCNIDCDYCILPNRNVKNLMSASTLQSILSNLAADNLFASKITILWHSGEPLTAGIDFYKRAFDLVSYHVPKEVEVTHSILTNGTLINNRWAEWFLENGVRVGVSCDGPAFLHDMHRKRRSGLGTHRDVMRGIRLLQEYEIDFYILSVLTHTSLKYIDEIFRFLSDNSIRSVCFNIEETEGVNTSETLSTVGIEEQASAFFEELLRRSFFDSKTPWIREFEEMFLRFFRRGDTDLENHLAEPFKIITVGVDGRWSTFSPELAASNFNFGNLQKNPISHHISNSDFFAVHEAITAGVAKCRSECEYFRVCSGGSPSNKYAECGRFDVTETKYCRIMIKSVADVCMSGFGRYVFEQSPSTDEIDHKAITARHPHVVTN